MSKTKEYLHDQIEKGMRSNGISYKAIFKKALIESLKCFLEGVRLIVCSGMVMAFFVYNTPSPQLQIISDIVSNNHLWAVWLPLLIGISFLGLILDKILSFIYEIARQAIRINFGK